MQEIENNGTRVSTERVNDRQSQQSNGFFDTSQPEFAAPRPAATRTRKSWKRRLVSWCLILLLVAIGLSVFYLLIRVNAVNVRVQAESKPAPQPGNADKNSNSSENVLSAEAINIARAAIESDAPGTDTKKAQTAKEAEGPVTSPAKNLSYSERRPTDAPVNKPDENDSDSRRSSPSRSEEKEALQSRANQTESLFVDDARPTRSLPVPVVQPTTLNLNAREKNATSRMPSASMPLAPIPPFGTMLPVRTRGVILSVRNNSYARLELTRDCQGEGWSISKGTLLVGRVNGAEDDRAFINVVGYIDAKTNRLVKMKGEVIGSDGGSGIQGKRIVLDQNRLKRTLSKIGSTGLQLAGSMAGALVGRGTVVLNGSGYRLLNPISDDAELYVSGNQQKRSPIRVEAGQAAYVMVADLPLEMSSRESQAEEESVVGKSLTDREVMELIVVGTLEDIRAAEPLMTEEQKRLVLKSKALEPER